MVLRRTIVVFTLIIFSFSILVAKQSEVEGQSGKEAELLNMSIDAYKEKVIDEKKDIRWLKEVIRNKTA